MHITESKSDALPALHNQLNIFAWLDAVVLRTIAGVLVSASVPLNSAGTHFMRQLNSGETKSKSQVLKGLIQLHLLRNIDVINLLGVELLQVPSLII